jgi:hypothetical protein
MVSETLKLGYFTSSNNKNTTVMNQEILQKLHEQKYEGKMSFEDYSNNLQSGLEMITADTNRKELNQISSMNLALEYNMELMIDLLLRDDINF